MSIHPPALALLLVGSLAWAGCQLDEPGVEAPVVIIEELDVPELPIQAFELPVFDGWETPPDLDPEPDTLEVDLRAEYKQVEVAPGRTLEMMTYNGSFPGPLIQAKVGDRVVVHFENALDEPTTVHWHGLRISDEMDGSPRIQAPVQPGETFTYDFVVPDAGTFWYHPHVRTNEQIERGLYGPLVVHDPEDPVVEQERLIVVDDALLDGDDFAPFLANHMEFVHGRTGNTLLINGGLELPIMAQTQARTERWRVVNTSNARTFVLSVAGGATMRIVGTDGGRLASPYDAERIEVAVGQRYDILLEHTAGRARTLTAHIPTLDASNNVVESAFALYTVNPEGLGPVTGEGERWVSPALELPTPSRDAEIVFDGYNDATGRLVWTLNGEADALEPLFTFARDEAVDLTLVNRQNPEHPFHLHGQFFEILDDGYGQSMPGLKDTVLVPGQRTVKIRAYMNNPGKWMAHCHILEHAELGMMSEIEVQP